MEKEKEIRKELKEIEEKLQLMHEGYMIANSKNEEESKDFAEVLRTLIYEKRKYLKKLQELSKKEEVNEIVKEEKEEIKENKKINLFEKVNLKRYPRRLAFALGLGVASVLSLTGAKMFIKNHNTNKTKQYCNYEAKENIEDIVQARTNNFSKPKELKKSKYKDASYYNQYNDKESKIECDHFKISKVAVLDNNTIIDVIRVRDDKTINFGEIKNKYDEYGLDISLLVGISAHAEDGKMVSEKYKWVKVDKIIKEKTLKKVKTNA